MGIMSNGDIIQKLLSVYEPTNRTILTTQIDQLKTLANTPDIMLLILASILIQVHKRCTLEKNVTDMAGENAIYIGI